MRCRIPAEETLALPSSWLLLSGFEKVRYAASAHTLSAIIDLDHEAHADHFGVRPSGLGRCLRSAQKATLADCSLLQSSRCIRTHLVTYRECPSAHSKRCGGPKPVYRLYRILRRVKPFFVRFSSCVCEKKRFLRSNHMLCPPEIWRNQTGAWKADWSGPGNARRRAFEGIGTV